ncbi:MAG TPA: glycoside hydrolase family 16 protein [Patescibacteria group bacterium]|nr:glycoside hydrolase family 16 protein [Patescibacteria group bacterium]
MIKTLKRVLTGGLLCCIAVLPASAGWAENEKHIFFSGYEWEVKSGYYGPGKNNWSPDNVWVDKDGLLHLKITRAGDQWYCAELLSVDRFAYGGYLFQVIGAIDQLDPNLVLGLFVYPDDGNPDPDNELDIEFTRWGEPEGPVGHYTVTQAEETHRFPFSLAGTYTTHRFVWSADNVLFQSFHGHTDKATSEFQRWLYRADDYEEQITVPPVRVHMNLWLFRGTPPLNGEEQEIVVKKFQFLAPEDGKKKTAANDSQDRMSRDALPARK